MRKRFTCWMIAAVTLLGIQACNKDYLDKDPLTGPSDADYFKNQDELLLAVNGLYKGLNKPMDKENDPGQLDGLPLVLLLDATSDIGYERNNSDLQKIGTGNHDANNTVTQGVWSNYYKVIGRCNYILDNAEKVRAVTNPALYQRSMGETRFVRAYMYQQLLSMFGGVPLVTHVLTLENAQVPRSDKATILKFVLEELDSAAAWLPATYPATDFGRATKGAALTVKARAALYNEQWKTAADAAKAVMDLGVYKLDDSYPRLFSYEGRNSPEVILSLQYQLPVVTWVGPYPFLCRNAGGASNKIPSQSLVDSYECTDGLTIDQSPLFNPQKPFENRDPRLGYTVALPGSIFFNYQFETHKDSLKCWNYNTNPATRIVNQDAVNAYASFSGYCWRKYVDMKDKDNIRQSTMNVTLARYAEVLLIYAEAKTEANELDATLYQAINAVRKRPGVNMPDIPAGSTQEALRSAVRKERLYELSMEGFRLFDIRRWKIADKVMKGPFYGRVPRGWLAAAPKIDANGIADYSAVPNKGEMRVVEVRTFNAARDYLWPIPYIETQTDPLIVQNPGY
ncbi:Starch-binding associating with outer membrane [Chitinophaga ginsengisegetis]|uniref:Starch-binding associating with outer membrane n=1 Tax=Chitinophaga ginsengisegetis TaxID=393003 RepID=A0A1T5NCU1_9BACT|nr:RagB/SusD family nutrient uptake outer membrane protein [Chitinophaga ginsengisegetis]SKC98350.1 Starch-binding associating with outer membrane [Chitinophaga ginsengisegetis]